MEFLRQLHVSPNTFLAQIRTYARVHRLVLCFPSHITKFIRLVASTVLQISHAHKVTGDDDWMLKLAERADHEFSIASTPGAFLVDVFPQCSCRHWVTSARSYHTHTLILVKYLPEWFPGAGFKCKAREWRKTMVQVRDEPYKYVSDLVVRRRIFRLVRIIFNCISREMEPRSPPSRPASSRIIPTPPQKKKSYSNGHRLHSTLVHDRLAPLYH